MTIAFFAHKGGQAQAGILPAPAPDPVVSFPAVLFNEGGHFDPAASRFTPPAGIYHMDVSINVANPVQGGKYYALVRKNFQPNTDTNPDAFELLRPNRMCGAADTVGTGVSGLVLASGSDVFEVMFQHSNVPPGTQCTLGGARFETWWSAHRVGDYSGPPLPPVPPPDTVEGTPGQPVGPIAAGNWTYVDRGWSLNPGATLAAVGMHASTPGAYPIKIVRRSAPGVYDVLHSLLLDHPGGGWHETPLAWTVPAAGAPCHLGAYTHGQTLQMFDLQPRACAPADITGSAVTMTEAGPAAGYYVIGLRARYAP